jgi:hypothetical protein
MRPLTPTQGFLDACLEVEELASFPPGDDLAQMAVLVGFVDFANDAFEADGIFKQVVHELLRQCRQHSYFMRDWFDIFHHEFLPTSMLWQSCQILRLHC